MKLEYMHTFLKVVEHGSLLYAARAMGMSVSTVSAHVNAVEEFFGEKLLERGKRGVELTEKGRIAALEVRGILKKLERARQDVARRSALPLRIALGNIPGVILFPEILREYRQLHPEAEFSVLIKNSSECASMLESSEVDIAVACFLESTLDRRSYECISLGADRLVLVVSDRHPLARCKKVEIRQVLRHPLVTLSETSGITRYLHSALKRRGILPEEIRSIAEVNSVFSQLHAVARNMGAAITSDIAARSMNSKVKIMEISDFRVKRRLYMVCRRDTEHPDREEFVKLFVRRSRSLLS
ncbi:LysR family transcriptional regulator [Candidatus Pyrohabitans sp.]